MTFTVKYRANDGAMREERIEAANRADCIAKCKSQGIAPVSVKEDSRFNAETQRRRECGVRGSGLRVAILLAVGVAGVGGVWWWTAQDSVKAVPEKPKAIQRSVPKISKVPVTNKVEEVKKPEIPKREIPPPGTRRHITSWKKPPGYDQMSPAQKTLAQPIGRVIKRPGYGKKRLFTEGSDIKIERLLRLKPGQMFLGTFKYDEKFVRDFIKSLDTPIVIDEKDSPEDKEMKQAVIDTRSDLKAAYDRGEDIAAIMTETEKQMRDMATYKMNLERMTAQQLRENPEMSSQDMADFIEAANTMLKERGMEPLKTGAFWYHRAKMQESRRQAEQQK